MNAFGHPSVGIVGGLGPETTAEFYLEIIRKFRHKCNSYPSILIDNVSFPFYLEKDIIQKSKNEEKILPFLKNSVKRLNKANVDFIVIPCNTVHIFIDELKKLSKAPIMSILDETVKNIKSKGFRKIGLLATTKSVDSKLYHNPLEENGIDVITPSKSDQKLLSEIIVRIIENKSNIGDRKILYKIIRNLKLKDVDCILLGCTDLQLLLKNAKIEMIDTNDVLVSATFNRLIDIKQNTNFKGRKYG